MSIHIHIYKRIYLKAKGQGTLAYNNGSFYEGEWENDQRNGQGKFISNEDGIVYVGSWRDGLKDGLGSLSFPTGDVLSGRWCEGLIDGPVEYEFNKNSPWLDPEY
jgi:hypothetical protein